MAPSADIWVSIRLCCLASLFNDSFFLGKVSRSIALASADTKSLLEYAAVDLETKQNYD